MDWLLVYCVMAPRSVRSASCWVTTIPRPPKSTSKWISTPCEPLPCRGLEVCDEYAPGRRSGVFRNETRPGIQAAGSGQMADRFRNVSRAAQGFLHHSEVGT